jgi:hypothetical protein
MRLKKLLGRDKAVIFIKECWFLNLCRGRSINLVALAMTGTAWLEMMLIIGQNGWLQSWSDEPQKPAAMIKSRGLLKLSLQGRDQPMRVQRRSFEDLGEEYS